MYIVSYGIVGIKHRILRKVIVSLCLSFSQGESVKYFLDNLEKLGQSVSPAHTAEALPIIDLQHAGWQMADCYDSTQLVC